MSERRTSVLVIDDEMSVRTSLGSYLEDRGFKAITVESGEEALDRLGHESVDFAIVDIRLPGMDGNDFIVSAHQIQPALVFLVHTGSTSYQLPEVAVAIGMSVEDVFRKPLEDMAVLVNAIRRHPKRQENEPGC